LVTVAVRPKRTRPSLSDPRLNQETALRNAPGGKTSTRPRTSILTLSEGRCLILMLYRATISFDEGPVAYLCVCYTLLDTCFFLSACILRI
ncbi:hypothetical protein RSAG8_00849, partial [Rhizoctonia solani AG-8 WAC10335]